MKQLISLLIFFLTCLTIHAQKEFHVSTNGKPTGNGSLENPWDLQTALSQKPEVVNGDDTIWLHGGTYTGRFLSTIKSTKGNAYITVAPFNKENVVLNGNIDSDINGVLTVKGGQVIFWDFEVTWLGNFSRDESDADFQPCTGVNHQSGANCRFYNLIIHDVPGLGFGSWKKTGGTIIENCLIFNNGYVSGGNGRGEGMYVQNESDEMRYIVNNMIFNNYYKGIEVWSASKRSNENFLKNVTLKGNVIFNSGLPSGNIKDNLIVASNDRNGINIPKNIQVLNNVFYHNTDFTTDKVNGDTPSFTLGYYKNAPVEDIVVDGNVIIGRDNALRLFYIKSVTFKNNTVFSKFLQINSSQLENSKKWNFHNNQYFTEKSNPFRVSKTKEYNEEKWETEFNLDQNSQWKNTKDFDLKNVLSISAQSQKPNTFNVALFNKQGNDVEVDFSQYNIPKGSSYTIYDAENRKDIAASGVLGDSKKIIFPMGLSKFTKPLHNDKSKKTESNFGAFIIEFQSEQTSSTEALNGFQKFLKWLGL